jgi:hypothetical protein
MDYGCVVISGNWSLCTLFEFALIFLEYHKSVVSIFHSVRCEWQSFIATRSGSVFQDTGSPVFFNLDTKQKQSKHAKVIYIRVVWLFIKISYMSFSSTLSFDEHLLSANTLCWF